MMGMLGVGDLHPGGSSATEFLLTELQKANPRSVLEVGAGAGHTTARMQKRGWRVTVIEPSPLLGMKLRQRADVPVHQGSFEHFESGDEAFDAVLGEGVFYGLDPKRTAGKLRRILRPGGLLAFVDMMWTAEAKADVCAFIHDRTKEAFGIAMAPGKVVTSSEWEGALRDQGFSEVATRRIEPALFDPENKSRRLRLALGLLAHPRLLPLFLTYRSYRRIRWAPPGWLESWMTVWRRGQGVRPSTRDLTTGASAFRP
jgi:SAM-dependent methyltransferase